MAITFTPPFSLATLGSLQFKQQKRQQQWQQPPHARHFRSFDVSCIQFHPPSVSGKTFQFSSVAAPLRCSQAESSQGASQAGNVEGDAIVDETDFSVLEEFIDLNVGQWSGTFTQYNVMGNELACVPTKLTAFSYGKGEQSSLCQTLFVRKAKSKTAILDDVDDFEWEELKLEEINISTFNNRQTTYFPGERAFSISHRTAEMLNTILRFGLLGDDDDEEESPKGLKLACRRPALVSESCLYSKSGNARARAFHVVDARGLTDLLGVFREKKDNQPSFPWSDIEAKYNESSNKHFALLGKWSGEAIIRRTGVYGFTIAKGLVRMVYEEQEDGGIHQEISSENDNFTKLDMNGTILGNVLKFSGGLQTTLLPEGMAMTSPISVGKSVGKSQSFFLEYFWIVSNGSRRRLVRTYDVDGVVVSTTLATEIRS